MSRTSVSTTVHVDDETTLQTNSQLLGYSSLGAVSINWPDDRITIESTSPAALRRLADALHDAANQVEAGRGAGAVTR